MSYNELDAIQPSPEPWTITLPPEIEFLVPQRTAWTQVPKTILQTDNTTSTKQKSITKTNSNGKLGNSTDALTLATATTFQSDNIDIISELQDESRQHSQLIDDHTNLIQTISQQIQELQQLQSWTDRILNLETKYDKIMQHNADISSDLNNISNYTIPEITSTLSGIKQIVLINDEKLEKMEDKFKHKLQRQQREIDNLYMIINTLHELQNNLVTPSDLRRKKKNKQLTNENKTSQLEKDDSQISDNDLNTIENKTDRETNQFQPNVSIQMSPIHTTDNTSNEQSFTINEFNQIENENSNQDSILNYSIDSEMSQTTQNESTGLAPRNLDSLHFPTLEEDIETNTNNNTEDLENLKPGQDT
jgi:hypothetical protein